jgi:hypothetical protein
MRRRKLIMLVFVLLVLVVAAAVAMLAKGPPVTLSIVGKSGEKYRSEVVLNVRIENRRLWPIYYFGGPGSASYRISRRSHLGWEELSPGQYVYHAWVIRKEKIEAGGSTNIAVYATEVDCSKESRIGLDCYTFWDYETFGRQWSRCLSFPSTVWSTPLHIDCVQNAVREIPIVIEEDGSFGINGTSLTEADLHQILKKVCDESLEGVPVVITRRRGTDEQKVALLTNLCVSNGFTNIVVKTIDVSLGPPIF